MTYTRIMRAAPRGYSTGSGWLPDGSAASHWPSGGKAAQLRRGPAFVIHQQRASRGGIGVGIQRLGQPDGRSRLHLGIVVEEENVFGVGRAPAEVHGLGESEVLGQPDELRLREIGVELRAAVARAIVHHDDLERLASLGLFEGFQAAPQQGRPVARNHHHRYARRLLFLLRILLGCQAT